MFSVLNFNAGDGPGTTMTFTIPITNDNIDEILENILLQGSAAAPGAFPQNSAQVQINDDDGELHKNDFMLQASKILK